MPNQINEDELQKAIDDITSSAQGAPEADGVAAPEVPAPAPETPVTSDTPEASAPGVAPMPDLGVPPMPPVPPAPGAFDPNIVAPLGGVAPTGEVSATMSAPEVQPMSETVVPEVAPVVGAAEEVSTTEAPVDSGVEQIKADILRDLSPLMDKVQIEPEKKFHIYQDMMITNQDKSVIPSAYETAKLINDEQKRGEALVSLIDALDG